MADINEKMRIHLRLKQTLCDEFDIESDEYGHFAKQIELKLGPGLAKRKKTLHDKFEALEQRGLLKVGQYETLRNMLEESNNNRLIDIISEAEKELERLVTPGQNQNHVTSVQSQSSVTSGQNQSSVSLEQTHNAASNRNSNSANASGNFETVYQRTGNSGVQETSGVEKEPPMKRIRVTGSDETDPADSEDVYKIGDHQKGYLLILNARENRRATDADVTKLIDFFNGELRFDYDDPRSYADQDFNREQFIEYLKEQQIKLNLKTYNNKYYCFICVILSHGSQKGIRTRDDGFVTTEEIRKMFNNKNMPNFTGRPKLFFIQACRGTESQQGVEYDDEEDDTSNNVAQDEDDAIVALPSDADTLIAFSTTPGWKSFRRIGGPVIGSWFIHECVEVFRSLWRSRHVEEMLIKVRSKVARDWQSDRASKQMPCVWSTLTKMLKLKQSDI